ncbi:hypothetical protein N799_05025 [Lysobacter arseniciresistens ZS79]|uniref:Uncharacterized protein n=1 Tax=Lysobacter arseniciresistens ZS79 TaxID=913325 RepID=A0A0A0EYW4_9GAMM|nr:hypothetical protein N799_05025 [Lysobacter arseniciresistens ZS79]
MSLRALHRRVSLWIQRPIGQLAGLLLLVAMLSAGISTGEVHAHADGDHAHDHAAQLADGLSDHDDPPRDLDPGDTTVLHAHDVGTTVSTLPTIPVVMLSALVPVAPGVHLTTSPPPSSARTPPHRPPIA